MQKRSKGERLGWKSYAHLPKQQIQIEMQKEFVEALKKQFPNMTQTKKQQEEVKQAMQQSPPKDERNYLFDITGCPGYEGYIPENLSHEVCRYCGCIEYYH